MKFPSARASQVEDPHINFVRALRQSIPPDAIVKVPPNRICGEGILEREVARLTAGHINRDIFGGVAILKSCSAHGAVHCSQYVDNSDRAARFNGKDDNRARNTSDTDGDA